MRQHGCLFTNYESFRRSHLFCVNVNSSKGSSFTVFFDGFDCGLQTAKTLWFYLPSDLSFYLFDVVVPLEP